MSLARTSRSRRTSRMLKKVILTFFNVASPAHVRTRSRQVKHLRARLASETSLSRTSRVFFNTLLERFEYIRDADEFEHQQYEQHDTEHGQRAVRAGRQLVHTRLELLEFAVAQGG